MFAQIMQIVPGVQCRDNRACNLFSLKIPVDNVPSKKNIDSVRISDSATSCSTFSFKGFGYTNSSIITAWEWFFGDGNSSNTQNTSYTYNAPENVTVKLIVTDVNGCKDSITKDVLYYLKF